MEPNRHSYDQAEEDYIYMEVGSAFPIFNHSLPPQLTRQDFEFQMSSSFERDAAPSPADELFYKGKLLPLHLPPRLQMVEKLLQNAPVFETAQECFSTPIYTPAAGNTPFASCTGSPSHSSQVSRELNTEEYAFECSAGLSSDFLDDDQNQENQKESSWTKKLKFIKQKQSSSIGSKLKASKSYLKSLFSKTACTNESFAADQCGKQYVKVSKKIPFGQIQKNSKQQEISSSFSSENKTENFDESNNVGKGRHRRSFSGAIKRMSKPRSSSSLCSSSSGSSSASSSNNSSGFRELPFFKRSNSVNSDIENPIQAAIAHCKRSQQILKSRNHVVSDLGFCSLNSSRAIYEDQRPGICRG